MYEAPPLPDLPPPFVPSAYQQAIFDFIRDGQGSAVVTAVAGSGKTSTILEALRYIPAGQEAVLLAFNAAIAAELKRRISLLRQAQSVGLVRACTFHSLGFTAVRRNLRDLDVPVEVQQGKLRTLAKENLSWIEHHKYGAFACKLVSLAKGVGLGTPLLPDTDGAWQGLIDHHDLILDEADTTDARAIKMARTLLDLSNEYAGQGLIDFDDQLYLVVKWDLPLEQVPWVFVDEAQDTNPIRRELVKRALAPTGRLIAVGDKAQSIYGWSGASHDAIDQIQRDFGAVELPLSVSYRCGTKIVEHAKSLVPQIEAAPGQIEGEIRYLDQQEALKLLTPTDAILCRTNAPLVEVAYELISHGRGCVILGRDIGSGLIALVHKLKAADLPELERKLQDYKRREVDKFLARDQPEKAAGIQDRVSCIRTIMDHLSEAEQSVNGLLSRIDLLFKDESGTLLTLSTIHKAKGREWKRVAILRPDLLPAPWSKQAWQRQQELNVCYVAWTRASELLIFVSE